jgi:UPF0176 protein
VQVNLSFYRFSRLEETHGDLQLLRTEVHSFLESCELHGTVLLAPEGINAMVAGPSAGIERFKAYVIDRFGILPSLFKEANVESSSFSRLLVKVKKQIITVGDAEVQPDKKTGQRVSPKQLKKWLDEGRPLLLLDTRNHYEVTVGTFRGAREIGIDGSGQFAAKAAEIAGELENHTVVTFCTGGIRCEKTSAVLLKLGLTDVYQLDGGILRYFEENGAAHFDGNCFVFDWRLAVDGDLKPVSRSGDPDAQFGRHKKQETK